MPPASEAKRDRGGATELVVLAKLSDGEDRRCTGRYQSWSFAMRNSKVQVEDLDRDPSPEVGSGW